MWSKDGRTIYYVSDRSGAQNVWARELERQSAPGNSIQGWPGAVAEHRLRRPNDRVRAQFSNLESRHQQRARSGRQHHASRGAGGARGRTPAAHGSDCLRSRWLLTARKIAFIVRGEVFAASTTDGGDAARVTFTPAEESQVAWSADSRRLVYVSDRDGADASLSLRLCDEYRDTADARRQPATTRRSFRRTER